MRVLMVSKACVVGAYQKKLEELAHLPEIELTVVVPPEWRHAGSVISLERRYTDGYELVVEPMALNGSFHLHFYPRLGRLLRRVRPDLVHIDEEPYNLATAHVLWLAQRAGARSLFFSWQNIRRRYPLPFHALERYVLARVAYGIVGNQESARVWRAKGFAGPLAVIPQFGVDPDLFVPAGGERPAGQPLTIGYVGRLVEEKGVDLMLEALAGLPSGLPWRATIIPVGPVPDELRNQAQRLGVLDRVDFNAQVSSVDMPEHYQGMDALVLPSRTRTNWKEQFGRVLVEAMACGVPVVGSDSGEIPHVIADAGLVFPEGRVDQLRAALARLLTEPDLGFELARRGRQRVLERYTQARVAAQTYEVYRSILDLPGN